MRRLMWLSSLYFIAFALAFGAASLVDGGAFWYAIVDPKPIDPKVAPDPKILLGIVALAVFYVPAMMAFWYAAALIVWREMSVMKAIFFSFVSVKRAAAAFTVYGLSYALFGLLLPSFFCALIASLIGNMYVVYVLFPPIVLLTTVVWYCSFYPTYTEIFSKPDHDPFEGYSAVV